MTSYLHPSLMPCIFSMSKRDLDRITMVVTKSTEILRLGKLGGFLQTQTHIAMLLDIRNK